jgi:hypothetical protein
MMGFSKPAISAIPGGRILDLEIWRPVRHHQLLFGGVLAAEAAVQPREYRQGACKQLFAVGMPGHALAHHQGALVLTFVIVVGQFAGGGQGAFGGNRGVKFQPLLAVQNAGQVEVGFRGIEGQEIKHGRNGETGQHLQVLLVAVVDLLEPRPDPQGVEDDVLPGVRLGNGAQGLSYGIRIQRHDLPPFLGMVACIIWS